jgi:putative acetyltransferase
MAASGDARCDGTPVIHLMPIRPARPDDHAALVALWERSVRATHHFLTNEDILSLRPLVAQQLAQPSIDWWVLASDADAPLGFLGFADDAIEALFIDPDHTGAGGGRRLVAHAQTLAQGRSLTVEVNEQNAAAVGFYAAQGFVVFDRSATDSAGRPFPLLRMRRPAHG